MTARSRRVLVGATPVSPVRRGRVNGALAEDSGAGIGVALAVGEQDEV